MRASCANPTMKSKFGYFIKLSLVISSHYFTKSYFAINENLIDSITKVNSIINALIVYDNTHHPT